MQEAQEQQETRRGLLSATEVGRMLDVDPTTIYRMAADGRLAGVRVGRQWRFRPEAIAAAFPGAHLEGPDGHSTGGGPVAVAPVANGTGPRRAGEPPTSPALPLGLASALIEVTARSLGVMMVVTDMAGRPLTEVANPSPWFTARAEDSSVLAACIDEWRTLADDVDLTPRFVTGPFGFDCARAFVRRDHTLVAMVLAGGVEPRDHAHADGLHSLDDAGRAAVIDTLPRVAAALARATDDPR